VLFELFEALLVKIDYPAAVMRGGRICRRCENHSIVTVDSLLGSPGRLQFAGMASPNEPSKTEPMSEAASPKKTVRSLRAVFLLVVFLMVIFVALSPRIIIQNNYRENAREDVAKSQIQSLTQAVQIHRLNVGHFPETLDELTKPWAGHSAILDGDALKDPWGGPYKYDPLGPRNGGKVPDIWTDGPKGDEKGKIGNWILAK
jgi:general secretion pathway protein G